MEDSPEVTIEQGKVRGGVATDIFGSKYFSFQGIPYAKPPIGALRFKAPVTPNKWSGTFDATKEGSSSITRDIYKNYTLLGDENLMFWIHGGGFIYGSSTANQFGPDFLITEEVVVVSINYRLGMLGFLSLKGASLDVPGNAGFKDMVMALKWVQKNISNFGGDPDNVTIFGKSAGGAAVHLLVLSPMAEGLFHRAVAQSCSALNPLESGHQCADEIAKAVGLEGADERTLLSYLSQKTGEDIFHIQEKVVDRIKVDELRPFGFVIEKNSKEPAFLAEDPIKIIASGKFNQVPYMTGYTTKEGMSFDFYKTATSSNEVESFEQYIPYFFGYKRGSVESKVVADKIKTFYYSDKEPTTANVTIKYDILTDVMFLYGIYETVVAHAAVSRTPVYLYQMSIESELNFLKNVMGTTISGVAHADDLGYLFKTFTTPKIKPGSLEEKGLRLFVKLWTNFAKFGNPTPQTNDTLIKVIWEPVKPDQVNYMDIGESLQMKLNPEPERIQFWQTLFAESPAGQKAELSDHKNK